ncbi:hypothetical protein M9194_06250 [Vibrio sp. S4M6]|uniref:ribonuclease T2 family protein n=1 Tax=Vibrio sinus TaxID=2946865 RepID=UPI00202A71CF|nr:hypothetical protein [Vibrio sinus]MCL9781025.1 hypothetical protein [Vibrio sinus]
MKSKMKLLTSVALSVLFLVSTNAFAQHTTSPQYRNWVTPAPGQFDYYKLSLTLQPVYCLKNPSSLACRTSVLKNSPLLTLNELIPVRDQGKRYHYQYCAKSITPRQMQFDRTKQWSKLNPVLNLTKPTSKALNEVMPQTRVYQQRHAWLKWGSCNSDSDDANSYFAKAAALTKYINNPDVSAYIQANRKTTVTLTDIRKFFNREFKTLNKIQFQCTVVGNRSYLEHVNFYINKRVDLTDLSVFPLFTPFGTMSRPPQQECPESFYL